MLTGQPPWTSVTRDTIKTFDLVMSRKVPPFPKNISDSCKNFLHCCVQAKPSLRWTAKELLKHPFITKYKKSKKKPPMSKLKIGKILKNKDLVKQSPYSRHSQLSSSRLRNFSNLDSSLEKHSQNTSRMRHLGTPRS